MPAPYEGVNCSQVAGPSLDLTISRCGRYRVPLPQADTLAVDSHRHMPFLMSVDPDNHPRSSPVLVIGDFQHTYLPESSAPGGERTRPIATLHAVVEEQCARGRADKTAMGLSATLLLGYCSPRLWAPSGPPRIGATDPFEGSSANPCWGQTRYEMAQTHHRSPCCSWPSRSSLIGFIVVPIRMTRWLSSCHPVPVTPPPRTLLTRSARHTQSDRQALSGNGAQSRRFAAITSDCIQMKRNRKTIPLLGLRPRAERIRGSRVNADEVLTQFRCCCPGIPSG